MTQHTKGPWEVVNLNHLGPHAIRMHYSDGKTFYGVRQIHREADARLIAAAPKLLEVCVEFVRRVEAGEIRSKRTYAAMKAVIEKATS